MTPIRILVAAVAACLGLVPAWATSWRPFAFPTDTIAATTTSASAALTLPSSVPPIYQIRVYNSGAVTVFLRCANSAPTALTTDLPIAAGAVELFTVGGVTHCAAITASGTATLYVSAGTGD